MAWQYEVSSQQFIAKISGNNQNFAPKKPTENLMIKRITNALNIAILTSNLGEFYLSDLERPQYRPEN